MRIFIWFYAVRTQRTRPGWNVLEFEDRQFSIFNNSRLACHEDAREHVEET